MAPLTRLVPMEAIHASSLNGQFGSALVTGPDFDDSSDISTFWTYGVLALLPSLTACATRRLSSFLQPYALLRSYTPCLSNGGLLYSRLSAALTRDATAYSSSHATITLQTRHRDLDIQAGVVKLGSRLLELRKRPACGFSPPTTILSREPDVE
ncbi:hypothetical protein E4U26_006621 [Claviceps purpurea]|nr:hypothetical protein E4U26_006621 [Claviceps purpurea]